MCGTVQFSDSCYPELYTLIGFGIALINYMTNEDAQEYYETGKEKADELYSGGKKKVPNIVEDAKNL